MTDTALSPERTRLLQLLRSKGRRVGNDILAQTLHGLGITHIFGTGGAPVDATLAACARAGMRVIGTRHQQAAALMFSHTTTCRERCVRRSSFRRDLA